MSKLEELIQQCCPNGVEYKLLGEVCDIHKGVQFNKSDMQDEGTYPVINGGINPSGYVEVFNEEENTITISQGGASAGYVNFLLSKFWLGAHCYAVKPTNEVKNRYLYHFIKQNEITLQQCQYGAGIPALAKGTITSLEIPIPPLPMQEEIVRILDTFTELQAELQAELQKRLQQYNYYREIVLTSFSEGEVVEEYTVQDLILSLKTGLNPRQNFKLNEPGATCPYITGKDIFSNTVNVTDRTDRITQRAVTLINKRAKLESDLLLFASTGTGTVGRMAIIENYKDDWNISETLYAIKPNKSLVSTKYLMYSLYADYAISQFSPKISKGSVPHLKVVDLLGVKVKVPSLAEQRRIVDILDRFDALTTDLTAGLPAEIEKRRQQYEYYRDKLLTFKRKEA